MEDGTKVSLSYQDEDGKVWAFPAELVINVEKNVIGVRIQGAPRGVQWQVPLNQVTDNLKKVL
jgi:hypothetical protein